MASIRTYIKYVPTEGSRTLYDIVEEGFGEVDAAVGVELGPWNVKSLTDGHLFASDAGIEFYHQTERVSDNGSHRTLGISTDTGKAATLEVVFG